jgi:hypothetical protein
MPLKQNAAEGEENSVATKIIKFEAGETSITLPDNWKVFRDRGTPIPFTERTYDFKLTPPSGTKAMGIVTIGKTIGGKPLSTEEFFNMYSSRVEHLLPRAVEKTAEYIKMAVNGGSSVYCILTDASLVGKTTKSDKCSYVAVFFANYDNGCLTYATLLTDDINSESFKIMLNAVASIEVSFKETSAYNLQREKMSTPSHLPLRSDTSQARKQTKYLSAEEIHDFLKKYIDERPIEQVKRELGEPTSGWPSVPLATWFKFENRLSIVMYSFPERNTVKLMSIADGYNDSNQRERRYEQMITDFTRIITIPPTIRTVDKTTWNLGNGWTLSIEKLATQLEYKYKFDGK